MFYDDGKDGSFGSICSKTFRDYEGEQEAGSGYAADMICKELGYGSGIVAQDFDSS